MRETAGLSAFHRPLEKDNLNYRGDIFLSSSSSHSSSSSSYNNNNNNNNHSLKERLKSSGVFGIYDDSDSDSENNNIRDYNNNNNNNNEPIEQEQEQEQSNNSNNSHKNEIINITNTNNNQESISFKPFIPPSITEVYNNIVDKDEISYENIIEFDAFEIDNNTEISGQQFNYLPESLSLYNLCSKEIDFLKQMESFTSLRKKNMQLNHVADIENISVIENQIRKTQLEEEKKLYMNQLGTIIEQSNGYPLNYNDLVKILSKFTSRIKDEGINSNNSIVFELTKEEEKKIKKYEVFVDSCYDILRRFKQYTQQLQGFLSNEKQDFNTLSQNKKNELQELINSLTQLNKNESIIERLRKGNDKIVLLCDQLLVKINSYINQSKPIPSISSSSSSSSTIPTTTTESSISKLSNPSSKNITTNVAITNSTTSDGFDILLSEGTEDESFISERLNLHQWIQNLLVEFNQVISHINQDGNEFLHLLQECLMKLHNLYQLNDEERTTSRLLNDILVIEQSLKTASNLPSPSSSITSIQWFLLSLFNYILNYVIRSDSEEKILMFGHISGAICRVCGKTSAKILYSYLCSSSIESINVNSSLFQSNIDQPNVLTKITIPITFNSQHKKRIILFYATQMGSVNSPTPSRIDLTSGWFWLVRCSVMISRYIHNQKIQVLNELCSILRGYLRFIGATLQLRYTTKFLSLMTITQSILSSFQSNSDNKVGDVIDLNTMLTGSLQNGILPSVLFKQKDSYSIYSLGVIKSLMKVKKDSDLLDADKTPEKKEIKSFLEVAAIPSAFNVLNADPATHERAVNTLSGFINRAVSYQNGEYLWYVLFKITKETVSYCQAPHFDVLCQSKPLASVICNVCQAYPNLSELYQMQFYKSCSFTIPQFYVDGEGDDMLINLGFERRKDKDGQIKFEIPTKWLMRMNKLIGIFASLIINPSNLPFSLEDGWLWLSKVINYINSKPGEAPPFTAKLLDTFLRIVSPVMFEVYGSYFRSLLEMIMNRIIPKLSESTTFVSSLAHKQQFIDFLTNFLESDGTTCLEVLNDM